MDRRSFVMGLLGLAGAAAVTTITRSSAALVGTPGRLGILDELEATSVVDEGAPGVELVASTTPFSRPSRRRRPQHRMEWRTVCGYQRVNGHMRRRCRRVRVWVRR